MVVVRQISHFLGIKREDIQVFSPKNQHPNIGSEFEGGKGPGPRVAPNGHHDAFPVDSGERWTQGP